MTEREALELLRALGFICLTAEEAETVRRAVGQIWEQDPFDTQMKNEAQALLAGDKDDERRRYEHECFVSGVAPLPRVSGDDKTAHELDTEERRARLDKDTA